MSTEQTDETVDTILTHYIAAALWSSHTSYDDDGEPLDENHDAEDIAPETLATMRDDVADFLALVAGEHIDWRDGWTPEQFGHDLWLTRNGHGAGFWDRGLGEVGESLSELARAAGGVDLYIGNDGLIYGS